MKIKNLFLKIATVFLAVVFFFYPFFQVQATASQSLANRLAGRILLAVESQGDLWYASPLSLKRYELKTPDDLTLLIKEQGQGISKDNLAKIPISLKFLSGLDSDNDGLPDSLESAIGTNPNNSDTDGDGFSDKAEIAKGYNPNGLGKLPLDLNFINKNKGKIFLDVQRNGEAWYLDPISGQRYFLGNPNDGFKILISLGLGINNLNLQKISTGLLTVVNNQLPFISTIASSYDLNSLEQKIFSLVNEERKNNGLNELKWNADIATVARGHSQELAQENEALTSMDKLCDYFFIHHEGFSSGFYGIDRLNNSGIHYFSSVGENIAMYGGKQITFIVSNNFDSSQADKCQQEVSTSNDALKNTLEGNISQVEKTRLILAEIAKRKIELSAEEKINVSKLSWLNVDELAQSIVNGWMNSPGHQANILKAEYDEAGMGVSFVNGYIIATQDFIQKVSCGFEGGPCCQSRGCYLPNTCQNNNICQPQ